MSGGWKRVKETVPAAGCCVGDGEVQWSKACTDGGTVMRQGQTRPGCGSVLPAPRGQGPGLTT